MQYPPWTIPFWNWKWRLRSTCLEWDGEWTETAVLSPSNRKFPSLVKVYWYVLVYEQILVSANSWLMQFENFLIQLGRYKLPYRWRIVLVYWTILLVGVQAHFHVLTSECWGSWARKGSRLERGMWVRHKISPSNTKISAFWKSSIYLGTCTRPDTKFAISPIAQNSDFKSPELRKQIQTH
jgi:hypothetical protein